MEAYLHRPEVKGEEEEDEEEAGDEAFAEPIAKEIGHDGTHAEEEVEKGGQRVPRKEPFRILEVAPVGHPCFKHSGNAGFLCCSGAPRWRAKAGRVWLGVGTLTSR